jgi:hypothetical protein
MFFYKFLEKIKNSKKNNENLKKYIFDIFTSFLVFLISFQKNLNFKILLNASFIKLLICLVKSTLILLVFKKKFKK